MALIDVSELMLDPDFVMTFTIYRRMASVNSYGENVVSESSVSSVGSIQAATAETAKRLPNGVQLSKFKTIFTKAVIQADSAGQYMDQIEWKSQRYNVFQVTPWEDFGAGWYMVDCELQKASL